MQSDAATPKEYIDSLDMDRKQVMSKMRKTILDNLPKGFKESMGYGMISYVVPHSIYPSGYHCNPKLSLPFISLASQKNYISFHHMALYEGKLLDWFKKQWNEVTTQKLDMGKCCVRFHKMDEIPFDLIGELCTKMTPEKWVEIYESLLQKRK